MGNLTKPIWTKVHQKASSVKYNHEVYTHINLGGLIIPLHVHISKIRDAEDYELPKYNNLIKYNHAEKTEDRTEISQFFYGKFRTEKQMLFICSIIHDFIDLESMEQFGYLTSIIPKDKKEFSRMIIEWDAIAIHDLSEVYQEILYYISKIKNDFTKEAIESIDLLKVYDEIPSKYDYTQTPSYKKYKGEMSLSFNMITLQSAFDHVGDVLFPENIGKAFTDYSWREKTLRRMYLKKKNDFDRFNESLQSKITDEMTEMSKDK